MNIKNQLFKRKIKALPLIFFVISLVIIFLFLLLLSLPPDLTKENCNNAKDRFYCYETYYINLVKKKGTKQVILDLKNAYDHEPYVKAQCHQLMHVVGRAAIDRHKNVAEAFSQGDPFCWSGYYHGVMEGVALKKGLPKLLSEINAICSEVKTKGYSFDYYNCVHGLGHGIMFIKDSELFDSLEICNNLNGHWEQSSCWSGVFMENIISDYKNHFAEYSKPEDPLYPCNAVDEEYKNTCYLMQTSHMLKVLKGNFSKVFEVCEQTGNYADVCYQSLGRDASGSTISNATKTKDYCLLGKDYKQRSNCIIGAVKDFISYFHSDAQAKDFCYILPTDLQKICFDTVKSYYANF